MDELIRLQGACDGTEGDPCIKSRCVVGGSMVEGCDEGIPKPKSSLLATDRQG